MAVQTRSDSTNGLYSGINYHDSLKDALQAWREDPTIWKISKDRDCFVHYTAKEIEDPVRMGVKRYFPIDSADPNTELWVNVSNYKIRDTVRSASKRHLNNEISDIQYESICENADGVVDVYNHEQFAQYCENN